MEAHKERSHTLAEVADIKRTSFCVWSLVVYVSRKQLEHLHQVKLAIGSTTKQKVKHSAARAVWLSFKLVQ